MKKLLITIPFLLLAAACNKQPAQVQPVQNQPVQQTQPTQQQPQATSTDVTVNWKTYTNSQLGFTIQYPATWVYDDTAGHIESEKSSDIAAIDFRKEAGGQWQVQVSVATTTKDLQSISANYHPNLIIDKGVSATVTSKMIVVDSQPAIQFSFQVPKGYIYYGDTTIFIVHSKTLYTISEGSGSDPDESAMLKSFKFTK